MAILSYPVSIRPLLCSLQWLVWRHSVRGAADCSSLVRFHWAGHAAGLILVLGTTMASVAKSSSAAAWFRCLLGDRSIKCWTKDCFLTTDASASHYVVSPGCRVGEGDETSKPCNDKSSKDVMDIDDADRRLFVFDFDLTIARYHLWATYRNAPQDHVIIDEGTFVDLAAFKAFVYMQRALGHEVAIATFGRREIVNKAITFALGASHGITISTPADHGVPEGCSLGSKNAQLRDLAKRLRVQLTQIHFFDDDYHNVREAVQIGVNAVHTPSGLTEAVLHSAKEVNKSKL